MATKDNPAAVTTVEPTQKELDRAQADHDARERERRETLSANELANYAEAAPDAPTEKPEA